MSVLPPPILPLPPKPSKRRRLLIAMVIAIAILLGLWRGGKGFYHNYRLSSAAVEQFHQRLDRGDLETIYGEATDEFRRAGSREDQIKFFAAVHQKMGNSGTVSAKGFHLNWQNGRLSVNQVYDTQFALGQAQEGFIWIIEQDRPRLQTYRIDSSNLR